MAFSRSCNSASRCPSWNSIHTPTREPQQTSNLVHEDVEIDITNAGATKKIKKPYPRYGRGVESVIVTDTRKLTGKAAKLYAGAQQTRDGVKALGRDQNAALMALGRYLGCSRSAR